MLRIVATVAILILVFAYMRTRGANEMNRLEAGMGTIGSLEGDRQVLVQLRRAGADLTKPTEVNFYPYSD
jgi:hypothetical protein